MKRLKFTFCNALLLRLLPLLFCGSVTLAQEVVLPAAPTDTLVRPTLVPNLQSISDIDIPIRINLKPIYTWANSFVDTLYTSPNYPNDWVLDGCGTRYQYRFVRGPFAFRAINNVLYVSFSGFYGVRGSTRLCTDIGNTPWTPACTCGFGTEKPRRIDAGFAIQFQLKPDYTLGVTVNSVNPVPVDKCTVCFFGKDITQIIATQLKNELGASIAAMQKQLQTFSLKPYLQTVWDTLQAPYRMPGFGFLSTQPQQLRISQAELLRDSMFFSLGITARPELKTLPENLRRPLPPITDFKQRSGFKIFIAQQLPYDSLDAVVNAQLAGKEFALGKGVFKKTVRIDSINLLGGSGKIYVKVFVSKAARGVFYLEGKPMWDAAKQEFWLDSLDYQITTKQLLIRTASNLLDGTIATKLKAYTRFNLADRVKALNSSLVAQMNRSVYAGITSRGYLARLYVDQIVASNTGVLVAGGAEGKLWLNVDAAALLPKK
ncbi:MAG: DUF4403 family protein [Bacteroidetes bacterium]|nr:MAG: DUF4403 family protein [Bacteroidota bacterium]